MTAFVIERNPVTRGVRTMLLAFLENSGTGGTDLYIEVGTAPTTLNKDANGRLIDPYAILYPIASGRPGIFMPFNTEGSLEHPEDGGSLTYQITSVGRTDQSAQVLADRIRRAIMERGANGDYVRPINAGSSMSVIYRSNREIGSAETTAGLWQAVDLYDLEVQAHG